MAEAADVELVRAWVEQIWNRNEFERLIRFHPTQFLNEGQTASLADTQAWHERMRVTYPDLHYSIEDIFAAQGKAALRWQASATQRGSLWGLIPPTNKAVKWSGMHIVRVEDGKIVEVWAAANTLAVLQQLGVTLQPPL